MSVPGVVTGVDGVSRARPSPPGRAPEVWSTTYRVLGFLFLAAWLVTLTAAWFLGVRNADYDDLRAAVLSGRTDEVRVAGGFASLGDGSATGSVTVQLSWREGRRQYVTEVVEQRPDRGGDGQSGGATHVWPDAGDDRPVTGDVVADLAGLGSDVRITTGADWVGTGATVWGMNVPTWALWPGLVGALGTLGLLVSGPQPWSATRWGWFWVLLAPAGLGVAAYLLLSGATLRRTGRYVEGRANGWWMFLVFVVLLGGS